MASTGDRCSLHRNEPGCVVGAHRQYLLAAAGGAPAALFEHEGGEEEELIAKCLLRVVMSMSTPGLIVDPDVCVLHALGQRLFRVAVECNCLPCFVAQS